MGHAIVEHLVTVVVLASILQATQACHFTQKYKVIIISGIPGDSPDPLKLHCRSKNDDLGYQQLSRSQRFAWTFCENVFPNSLYYCDVSWGQRVQSFHAFDSKDPEMCEGGVCFWLAQSDGIYFARENSPWYKKFDWYIRPGA